MKRFLLVLFKEAASLKWWWRQAAVAGAVAARSGGGASGGGGDSGTQRRDGVGILKELKVPFGFLRAHSILSRLVWVHHGRELAVFSCNLFSPTLRQA